MSVTREDVLSTIGPVDDQTLADIMAVGASADELAEAQAWLSNDEPLVNAYKAPPKGKAAQLVEILARLDEEAEPDGL